MLKKQILAVDHIDRLLRHAIQCVELYGIAWVQKYKMPELNREFVFYEAQWPEFPELFARASLVMTKTKD